MYPIDIKSLKPLAAEVPFDKLVVMDPAKLGPILLRIAAEQLQQGMFQPKNVCDHRGVPVEIQQKQQLSAPGDWSLYPMEHLDTINNALAGGWNWLVQNGFIMDAAGSNGTYGWKMLTKKGSAEVDPGAKSSVEVEADVRQKGTLEGKSGPGPLPAGPPESRTSLVPPKTDPASAKVR